MADTSVFGMARHSAGWAIALCVLLILAGVMAIVVPPAAGIAVAILVAWLVLIGGVAHLAMAWQIRSTGGAMWEVLIGLVYLALGVYLLTRPVLGLASLTLLLACYIFAKGILELILSFRIRPLPGSGWLFFDGIVALALGAMIGLSWPWSSEWAIGTLIGLTMLFAGITRLPMAVRARRFLAMADKPVKPAKAA